MKGSETRHTDKKRKRREKSNEYFSVDICGIVFVVIVVVQSTSDSMTHTYKHTYIQYEWNCRASLEYERDLNSESLSLWLKHLVIINGNGDNNIRTFIGRREWKRKDENR